MNAHLELVDGPDWTLDPLTLERVRDDHLHVTNTVENDYIASLMKVSDRQAERVTRRAHLTQRWMLVADRFPCAYQPLVLPKPPTQEVEEIRYVDADGVEQVWGGSPLPYDVSAPSGPEATCAEVRPVYNTQWPVTRFGILEAVFVTFRAGYPEVGSPAVCDVPEDITHGRLILIAELYKQRSESIDSRYSSPAFIRARDLWLNYRVYRGSHAA